MTEKLNLLVDLIGAAKKAGADAADAVFVESLSLGASYRLGRQEDIERSESHDLGLRVFIGKRQASVSSTDLSKTALQQLVERVLAMARNATEDPYCGLAEPDRLCHKPVDLDLNDKQNVRIDDLIERARRCEEAALAIKGVTNSEGAGANWGQSHVALATSGGFAAGYSASSHGVSVSVIAGSGTGMERDYDFSTARHLTDLSAPEKIGQQAGALAISRLNPRKMPSQKIPVVFAPRVAGGLLGHLAGAIAGPAIARGVSFLKDRLQKPIFGPNIAIYDDPHRRRGLRSRPFDGEGVTNRSVAIVANGVLTTWLLDSASARQLKMATTGHAGRGTSGPPAPGPSNLYLDAGTLSPEALIADIKSGFYVTELIGFGVNGVTGDYSRGAAGFWIDGGKITFPVSEMTIAGNLKDMFLHLTPASDLAFRYGTDSPTVRIEQMTVAGA